MTASFGIDISSNSLTIDWPTVIATLNPRFVYARAYHVDATLAGYYADPKFGDYWTALTTHQFPRGAYVRCNPNIDPQQSIADFFGVYKPQLGDLLPAVDIEDEWDNSSTVKLEQRIQRIGQLINFVANKICGQMPLLYTKQRVWNDLGNPTQFTACPLWVQDYVNAPPAPPSLPVSWPSYAFWQYQQNKNATGIADYDPDLFDGPETALSNFTIKQVSP